MRGRKDVNQHGEGNQYLSEVFNFSCVLRGDVKYELKPKAKIQSYTIFILTGRLFPSSLI